MFQHFLDLFQYQNSILEFQLLDIHKVHHRLRVNVMDFPDFSIRELGAIFRQTAKKNKYILSKEVEHYLNAFIDLQTEKRDKNFGNGRWVRNLFEKTVERQSLRVVNLKDPPPEELMTIRLKDVGIKLKDPNASAED